MTALRFAVTDRPPWYTAHKYTETFTCNDTKGLFQAIYDSMLDARESVDVENKFKPRTLLRTIRDKVIAESCEMVQKPSQHLVMALMDVIDLQGSDDSDRWRDRAGLRQLMLSKINFTLCYVTENQLVGDARSKTAVRHLPVVTYLYDDRDFRFHDKTRSLLGTYVVDVTNGPTTCFMQEALYVPGPKSLELLKTIVGSDVEFWDMSLEVPAHPNALMPTFQYVKPDDIFLRAKPNKTAEGGAEDDAPPSSTSFTPSAQQDPQPMCCVLDEFSINVNKSKRVGSVDCFDSEEILANTSRFVYTEGIRKAVYVRRTGKKHQGIKKNLIPVVRIRHDQAKKSVLYVSTTARFCRAVSFSCEKGNSTLLFSCHKALLDLGTRMTFLLEPELHQDIQLPVLTAFVKRVGKESHNRWCVYAPAFFESLNPVPYMSEVIDLGIRLMDNKIPNAFVVAELLYCSHDKVEKYKTFLDRYSSDKQFRDRANVSAAYNVQTEMDATWLCLVEYATEYLEKRYENAQDKTTVLNEFKSVDVSNAANVQKKWQSLVKHETSAKHGKDLSRLYDNMKVLFHNLRVYQNKLTRLTKATGDVKQQQQQQQQRQQQCKSSYGYMTIPDQAPLPTWIKHLGVLLMTSAWLYSSRERRELVCDVLGLDKDLTKSRAETLEQWAVTNVTTVERLKSLSPLDRLSSTLVGYLERTSLDRWVCRAQLAFGFKRDEFNHRTRSSADDVESECLLDNEARETSDTEERGDDAFASHDEQDEPLGENLSDTEYYDETERVDEYDTTDKFINDEYVDDQYSGDSEASLEPVDRTKKQRRKLHRNSAAGKRARLVSDDDEPNLSKRAKFLNEQGSSTSDSMREYKKQKPKDRRFKKSLSRNKNEPTRDTALKEGAASVDYKTIKKETDPPKKQHKSEQTNVTASPKKSSASERAREEYAHSKGSVSSPSRAQAAIPSPEKDYGISVPKPASSKGSFSPPNVASLSSDATHATSSTEPLSPRSAVLICPELSDLDECDSEESTSGIPRTPGFNVCM